MWRLRELTAVLAIGFLDGEGLNMRRFGYVLGCVVALGGFSSSFAAEISGEYLEARTCDVYTGPCFANGEIGIAGKEAVMAWKIDEGRWAGKDLAGLGVAVVIKANDTLGFGGSFYVNPDKISAVIVVDDKADDDQKNGPRPIRERQRAAPDDGHRQSRVGGDLADERSSVG